MKFAYLIVLASVVLLVASCAPKTPPQPAATDLQNEQTRQEVKQVEDYAQQTSQAIAALNVDKVLFQKAFT